MKTYLMILTCFVAALPLNASAGDDISLFDSTGNAIAYIAVDDDLTVYLWGGKPVAYLEPTGDSTYDLYGFNGKHLGWFTNGVIENHGGNAACATKERLPYTNFEPFKSFKQFKPFKAFKQLAPYRPYLTRTWSDVPCGVFLAGGAE